MSQARTLTRTAVFAGLLAVIVVIVVSCTAPEPDVDEAPLPPSEPSTPPPTGASLAIVLPPAAGLADPEARDIEVQLQALGIAAGPDVTGVRTLRADAPEFVADLAALMADRDHDLVCVIGHGARAVVAAQADLHPEGRYCATPSPSDTEPPPSVTLIDVRFVELGHLVGVAAAAAADGGPVGLILDDRRAGAADLRAGLLAGIATARVVEVAVTDELTTADAVASVVGMGASVVVVDTAADADTIEAVSSLAGRVGVLAPAALLGEASDTAVLAWRVRWDVALRPVVDALVAGELGGIIPVGLAEDVVELTPGSRASQAERDRIEVVREELVTGARDPAVPDPAAPVQPVRPVPEPPALPEPDGEPDGEPGDESGDESDGEPGDESDGEPGDDEPDDT